MNSSWIEQLSGLLNRKRLSYAWIAGGALWIAWFLSIFSGSNGFDRAGQVIGTDYIQFYAASQTLLRGDSAYLYDFNYQSSLEREIIGGGLSSFHAFITPPLFAVIFLPFSLLPYVISFAVWSILGLFFLWLSVHSLSKNYKWKLFAWSLIWFPVFASISFGQNSLISLVILTAVFLSWIRNKYFLSGVIASLLFYKPQLLVGVILVWILEFKIQRKALAGFTLAILAIIVLNVMLFPEASLSYWNFVITELPTMISQDHYPIWHLHTFRGFWMMLLGGNEMIAEILYILSVGLITIGFIKFYKRNLHNKYLIFSAAICFTLLITPHAMIYDWSLLLIPAILLWFSFEPSKPLLSVVFAMMWIGAFLSGPLAFIQLRYLDIALQISVPIFILSSLVLYKHFMDPKPHQEIHLNIAGRNPD